MTWRFLLTTALAISLFLPDRLPLFAAVEQNETSPIQLQMADFPQFPEFYTSGDPAPRLLLRLVHNGDIRWQQEVSVYDYVRSESFDLTTGTYLHHQLLHRRLLQVAVDVPVGLNVTHAEFHLLAADNAPQLLTTKPSGALWVEQLTLATPLADSTRQQSLATASITSILKNGPSLNRIDIVLLGDGYKADEMAKWQHDAMTVMEGFLAEPPYDSYQAYFNVHRIDVPSNESGVSRANGVQRDTAFGSFFNCAGIQRLICGDDSLVAQILDEFTTPDQRDIVVIIANDSEYGGSGGKYAYASMHTLSIDLVLHETAHNFGKLADEYDGTGNNNPACRIDSAIEANVSPLVSREQLKWNHWVDPLTAVPTLGTSTLSMPGLYRGSKYCDELYRPTPNSKMRSLGRPFDAINEEALILRIYAYVSPIDAVFPPTDRVLVSGLIPGNFTMTTPTPTSHPLTLQWYVGNQLVQTGGDLDAVNLPPGRSIVTVRVSDPVNKVRRDDAGWLNGEHTWTVDKQDPALAATAVFDQTNNVLFLPAVHLTADNTLFQAQLKMISESPVRLQLTSAYQLDNQLASAATSAFSGDTLRVERLEYYGAVYNADFRLIDAGNMIFELNSAVPLP